MAVSEGAAQTAVHLQEEVEVNKMLTDTFWCYSCLCFGCGLAAPTPCCWEHQKCLCVRQRNTTGADFCGEFGCNSVLSKFLCLMSIQQCPPTDSSDIRLGCCNIFCLNGQPRMPTLISAEHAEHMDFFQNTFWCYYCCCYGQGCTRCGNPLIKAESKLCCIKGECGTADCCGAEGCCFNVRKECCCVAYEQFPPRKSPGIGCCNILFAGSVRDSAREVMVAPTQAPPQQMQMTVVA